LEDSFSVRSNEKMAEYRDALPQLSGSLYLTDAGIETDLIFNHGIEIREFAAHTLLPDPEGREAIAQYLRGFLSLAERLGTGFILDSQTWKAHPHWAADLGASHDDLRQSNCRAISFLEELRAEFAGNDHPVVINGVIGPRGDAYAPEEELTAADAEDYHNVQIGWLADTAVDMVTALTFTQATEAIGVVRAARKFNLPIVVSFTVETDGKLPTGQPLGEAIQKVDQETDGAAAYFMVNCAHPEHFFSVFDDSDWTHRIRGIRCNASRLSHAELDECEVLDDGDPAELASQYKALLERMPWINVFGGCCGSDLRHVTSIAKAITA
jgi:homocysteine S-methyltransferase